MTYSNKEKQREHYKKWRAENKDKIAEYLRVNKEKISERNKKYYELNKEKRIAYAKKYRELNKENRLDYERKYNEEHKEHKREQRKKRKELCLEYLGGKCVKCGTTERLEFDHIKREGKKYTIASRILNNFDNLKEELNKCQLLCVECHLEKTASEWTK